GRCSGNLLRDVVRAGIFPSRFWPQAPGRQTLRSACQRASRAVCATVAIRAMDSDGAAHLVVLRDPIHADCPYCILAATVGFVCGSCAVAGVCDLVACVFASEISHSRSLARAVRMVPQEATAALCASSASAKELRDCGVWMG